MTSSRAAGPAAPDAPRHGPERIDRLITISMVLSAAGKSGRSASELADIVGYVGEPESRREMLARDIRDLRLTGLEIKNVVPLGAEGRWVLRPGDSRIRVAFTPGERSELVRAALLSGARDLAERIAGPLSKSAGTEPDLRIGVRDLPPALDRVQRAVVDRCLLTFTYNGTVREVDPCTLACVGDMWAVHGRERQSGTAKTFSIARMTDIAIALPGTADVPPGHPRQSLDPLTWPVDPPIAAEVTCPRDFVADVVTLLSAEPADERSEPADERSTGAGGESDRVLLRIEVRNRWIFLARVIELAERVRLEGPEELREELRDRLIETRDSG